MKKASIYPKSIQKNAFQIGFTIYNIKNDVNPFKIDGKFYAKYNYRENFAIYRLVKLKFELWISHGCMN